MATSGPPKPIERILIATDFSDLARVAADLGVEIAQRLNATITLFHAYNPPRWATADTKAWPEMITNLVARVELALASARADLVARCGRPVDAKLAEGDPATEIVRAAAQFDLVVVGTHGRSGLRHVLIGSVAEKVVRGASCPVLSVRDPGHSYQPP